MRQEVVRLNQQLQISQARSDAQMKQLSKELAAQQALILREQAAARDASVGAIQPQGSQPVQVQQANREVIPPPAPSRLAGKIDYDGIVRQGVELLQNGDASGALKLAQQLIAGRAEPMGSVQHRRFGGQGAEQTAAGQVDV